MNDLRFALRQLMKNPGFTVVAGLTLALGIGATTAIFSVVEAVLLRPLPYPEASRLVRVHETVPARGIEGIPVAIPNFRDWQRRAGSFRSLAAHQWSDLNHTGNGEARRVHGCRVTTNLFEVLGVRPAIGRTFSPEEETRGRHYVTLISHAFWMREFGGDRSVLGSTLRLDGETYQVVGVMPPGFAYPARHIELWLPAAFQEGEAAQRGQHSWGVVGRLRDGVGLAQASEEIRSVAAVLARENSDNGDFSAQVVSLHDNLVGESRRPLWILLGAVGCVLAIACANVANLQLARSATRRREFAVRAALGAGRVALLRQVLLESLVLSGAGGLAGVLLALASVSFVRTLPGHLLPRADEVRLSLPVLGFALGLSGLTGILFGLLPALQASSTDSNEALKEGGRGGSEGTQSRRYRAALVVAEVALSMVLLAGAGLLLRSFLNLRSVDLGFRPDGVTTANLLLPDRTYPGEQVQAQAFSTVVERLAALPGVESAAAVFGLPQGTMRSKVTFEIEGRGRGSVADSTDAEYRQVTPGYFRTMGIPLRLGRDFGAMDTTRSLPVAVVNEAFLRRHFPDTPAGAIPGTRINIQGGSNTWLTLVGVVGDVRSESVAKPPGPEVFVPMTQTCWGFASLVVRSRLESEVLAPSMKSVLASVDGNLPLDGLRPLRSLVDDSMADRRLQARLLGGFSLLALVLSATGIYGVMAYSVSRRVQEIGIRMALGAGFRDIVLLVLRQGLGMTAAGLALGLVGGLFTAQALSGLLFGVHPGDPPTFGAVTVLLGGVAMSACWWPARRAARVPPITALRSE